MSWDAGDMRWGERVEFLNPGGSMDKGPEVGGGSGGGGGSGRKSTCQQSSVRSDEARGEAEARLCSLCWPGQGI